MFENEPGRNRIAAEIASRSRLSSSLLSLASLVVLCETFQTSFQVISIWGLSNRGCGTVSLLKHLHHVYYLRLPAFNGGPAG